MARTTGQTRKATAAARGRKGGRNVRLRPANPFDLISLIAHSQSDPRKAMAELVQNSLDAGARQVTVTRRRRRGDSEISVLDDGRGVFPELERPEALERIATNIGHSFKRNLSPAERQQQMLLGKYGIGILGFWCVGRELEMCTRVGGSEVWALRLVRDEPLAEVERLPERRLSFEGETWTEVVIRGIHPAAARQLTCRRLGDYLGSELRGQLLGREVRLRMVDRLARGRALKDFLVVPRRFQGRRLEDVGELPVAGHAAARLELYFLEERGEEGVAVALASGGAVVCDDLGAVEGYGLGREVWCSGHLEGLVEFPDLHVAPSTRRGFVPGPEADSLFAALRGVEPLLREIIEREAARRSAQEDEDLARAIRKAFRPLVRSLPQYDFFEIRRDSGDEPADEEESGARLGQADLAAAPGEEAEGPAEEERASEVIESGDEPEAEPEILPPGPLETVKIVPRRSRLLPGARRVLVAKAFDAWGRRLGSPEEAVGYAWRLLAGQGTLEAAGDRATFVAPAEPAVVRVEVTACQGGRECQAQAEIEVVEKLEGESPDAGIPDPKRVFDPRGDWRSRVIGRRWEYNAAHPDYQTVEDDPKRRLRYLIHLFAKEIVLRNYGEPKDERLLERLVEVLTHIRPRV